MFPNHLYNLAVEIQQGKEVEAIISDLLEELGCPACAEHFRNAAHENGNCGIAKDIISGHVRDMHSKEINIELKQLFNKYKTNNG